MKQKKKGNYAFIDSQNLNLGIRSMGWKLHFKSFLIYLQEKYHVTKAFLFIGYLKRNENMYKSLQADGYILVFKPTLEYKKGERRKTKGNVDAELVMHTMINLNKFNKAIIVSGDGDFHCLIEYLEKKTKLLKVIVPNHKYSSLLKKFAKHIVQVKLFRNKVELKKPKRKAFPRDKTLR